jgi:hypothetical protein
MGREVNFLHILKFHPKNKLNNRDNLIKNSTTVFLKRDLVKYRQGLELDSVWWRYNTQHKDIQNNDTQHKGTLYVMMSVSNKPIMLSVVMLNVIMLSVIAPSGTV